MKIIDFKNHRKFINIFSTTILKYNYIYLNTLKIKGFYFSVKGKISVAGNGKKKRSILKIGKVFKSTKFVKIEHKHSVVKTNFGALGVNMIIAY